MNFRMSFELFIGGSVYTLCHSYAVAPKIIASPEDRTELEGDTTVFTCNATGRPRPNITWWRYDENGSRVQLVNEMDKVVIESMPFGEEREQTSSLTILDVQPSDVGTYQCQAENGVSTAEDSATLTVYGK